MILQLLSTALLLYVGFHVIAFIAVIRRRKRMTSHLPQPVTVPIAGSAFHIKRTAETMPKSVVERANRFARAGADTSHLWIFHECFVMPLFGKSVKAILDSQEEITKGRDYEVLVPWLGRGLLISDGEKWRNRRRLLTPTFHFNMLDSYVSSMNRHAKVFVDDILAELADGRDHDLYPLIKRCTLDIICDTAMGKELDSQHDPNQPYSIAVSNIVRMAIEIVGKPIYWSSFVRKLVGLEKVYQGHVKIAHDFTTKIIHERIEAVKKGEVETNKRAFLDLLIAQMGQEKLTVEDLREEVDTFMFEGHDTTASGLAWSVWSLACHPEYQQRAYDEIHSIFGDDDRSATREDLHEMHYVERCIKEALRLFPPVPIVMRKLQKDFVSGSHTLPEGVIISIVPMAIHRNELIYPNALTYDPDRFLPENMATRHPFDYIPFSAGPRNCIGQRFAMYEEKVVLSWLLRRFRFETNLHLLDNPPLAEAVLRPKLGCLVRLVPRQ